MDKQVTAGDTSKKAKKKKKTKNAIDTLYPK